MYYHIIRDARFPGGLTYRLIWLLFALRVIYCNMANAQLPQSSMPPSSSVVELNLWTIRGSIGDGRLWFLMFYVPWCRGCKRMSGQWDALGDAFRNYDDTLISRFDCMQAEDFCERLGVDRTPTLKLFLNGTAIETYRADFYHIDMMKPFLERMRAKYITPAAAAGSMAASRENDVSRNQFKGQKNPTGAGQTSARPSAQTPADPSRDMRTRMDDTSALPYDSGSGRVDDEPGAVAADRQTAESPRDDVVKATPVKPGVYDRPAGEEGSVDGGEGAGTHGGGRSSEAEHEADAERHETRTKDRSILGSEPEDGELAAGRVGLEATAAASSGTDEVPLTRRGRQGGLAVEMLQKDKEEL